MVTEEEKLRREKMTIDFKEQINGWQNIPGKVEIFVIGLAPSVAKNGAAVNKKPLSTSHSGKIFWTLLKQAELDTKVVYITNLIKHPLPDNREPTIEEIKNNIPLLIDELELHKPDIILCLGKIVANEFKLEIFQSKLLNVYSPDEYCLVKAIYHPIYLSYNKNLFERTINFIKSKDEHISRYTK